MRKRGEDWDQADKNTLARLWVTPMPASEIGANLTKVRKKNAVIGMADRMKLGPKPKKPPKVKVVKPPVQKLPRLTVTKRKPAPKPAQRTLLPRRAPVGQKCKWPIGDPASEEFHFCGVQPKSGPYCDDHAKVAYDPPSPRRATHPSRVYTRTRV